MLGPPLTDCLFIEFLWIPIGILYPSGLANRLTKAICNLANSNEVG